VQQPRRSRTHERALERALAIGADHDHPRVVLVGHLDERLGRGDLAHDELDLDPGLATDAARLLEHTAAVLAYRLVVVTDLAPEATDRIGEDGDEAVVQLRRQRHRDAERGTRSVGPVVAHDLCAHVMPPVRWRAWTRARRDR
jgi:hypothetical protein